MSGRVSVFSQSEPSIILTDQSQVGENLTEWEGSPSSGGESEPPFLQTNTVKYIPINYFEYFDNGHLDSDEFSRVSVLSANQSPVLF